MPQEPQPKCVIMWWRNVWHSTLRSAVCLPRSKCLKPKQYQLGFSCVAALSCELHSLIKKKTCIQGRTYEATIRKTVSIHSWDFISFVSTKRLRRKYIKLVHLQIFCHPLHQSLHFPGTTNWAEFYYARPSKVRSPFSVFLPLHDQVGQKTLGTCTFCVAVGALSVHVNICSLILVN